MAQIVKRGIIQSFSSATYTASILLLEATSTFLANVPLSTALDGSSAVVGGYCAVLFFDEHNQQDAVILAVYPNGTSGVPTPPPGRVTFVVPYAQVAGAVIAAGATNTYTLNSGGSNLPTGILGVLYKAYFTSATVGAYMQLGPHGSALSGYDALGNMQVGGQYVNGSGIVPVDASGRLDITALVGSCTVTLYTYGYVI